MKIKVEPFMMRRGNRVGQAGIEFTDGILAGFMLTGFTICDDKEKGLFVLFPSAQIESKRNPGKKDILYFLKGNEQLVEKLENEILDVFESMTQRK